MPRVPGRLLAALLIASPIASASLILADPEAALTRPESPTFPPTPQFGPKFHFKRGPELIVYPRNNPTPNQAAADMLSLTAIGIGFAMGVLSSVPRFQRILIMLKLMD